ncbi:MAG: hypothetical protein M1813_008250 [Trichoglossum hirsutum]|nr:MAG: hypothetical protein M1813_008250 [Trichoglossum hirsutum]
MSSATLLAKETPDDALIFSYSVRALIRNPECIPRQAFLDLLEKVWRQVGFEPIPFARDFLKYPPSRVVLVPTKTDDGSTKLKQKALVKGINHEPLDLHRLYCEVWKRNGFDNVTNNKQWPLVAIACNFLKTEHLSKAAVDKMASGGHLNPGEQGTVTNTRNTYERYLLQLELRMADARRILATRGRYVFNRVRRSRYNSHSNRDLVEGGHTVEPDKPTVVVPYGLTPRYSMRGSQTILPQPHLIHTCIELKPVSGLEFNSNQSNRKMIGGSSTSGRLLPNGLVGEQERTPAEARRITQDAITVDYRPHGPLDPDIENTVIQASEFLHQSNSAAQLTSRKGEERHEPLKGADTEHESEGRENLNHPLRNLNFSNFSWDDQIKEEIISTSPRSNKFRRELHSTISSWYWAAASQRADMYSTKATPRDNEVQIPSQRHREHIVPEAYWAAEGRRLGIRPVSPEDPASAREFREVKYDRENNDPVLDGLSPELCESNGLRRISHRLRRGLAIKMVALKTGKPPGQLINRIFGRRTTPNRSDLCRSKIPTVDHGVAGLVRADNNIIHGPHPPVSYPTAADKGTSHEMTYRAKVERYEQVHDDAH